MSRKQVTIESGLRGIAGAFVTISVALGVWVNPWFLAFTAFVGLNLLQSAFTGWCPMMSLLEKLGMPRCAGSAGPRSGDWPANARGAGRAG